MCTQNKKMSKPHIISSVPNDLIFEEMLIRLPLKTLARCRYVCRLWNSVISDPAFIQPHLNRTISQNPNDDYLIRTWPGGISILSRTNLSESPLSNIPYDVHCADRVRLLGSINGLVCLARHSRPQMRFILWNPAIHIANEILVPQHCCKFWGHFYRLGFSWDSVGDDFKLIAIYRRNPYSSRTPSPSAAVYSCKTNCWTYVDLDPQVVQPGLCPSVIVKGIPYWKCDRPPVILKFEPRSNEFAFLTVSEQVGRNYSLVNLNDCLARIDFVEHRITDSVDVYQFNEEDNSWFKKFRVDFGENRIFSEPTCFKYDGDIVFNAGFTLSDSGSSKIKHLSYEANQYLDIHGHTYTPSLIVLEGMEPLRLRQGGGRSPGFWPNEAQRLGVATILVGKPSSNN